jgi:hypothetical protein
MGALTEDRPGCGVLMGIARGLASPKLALHAVSSSAFEQKKYGGESSAVEKCPNRISDLTYIVKSLPDFNYYQLDLTYIAIMFRSQIIRQVARAATAQAPRVAFRPAQPAVSSVRHFTSSPSRFEKDASDDQVNAGTTSGEPGESGEHEGQYARTRDDIVVEYPEEKDLPPSNPVVGRGGEHFKRTLASFSMESRVAVVTGGARGLGLVMAQALVTSGADVAIVDMNREEGERSAKGLIDIFKKENPQSDK